MPVVEIWRDTVRPSLIPECNLGEFSSKLDGGVAVGSSRQLKGPSED
jgi:hypothetical protein